VNEHRTPSTGPGDAKEATSRPRIGVYVCQCGGNISDVVDVEQVAEAASRLGDVAVARHHSAMCSQAGQELMIDDVGKENLDRVVIAACTPSLHEHTFRAAIARAGQNPFLYEHVNLREQVSWCSHSDPEGATRKAIRLVGAGVAKARLLRPLSPISKEVRRHVTVVGGGVSGLRAARDLSRAGLAVALIEESGALGGRVAQWSRLYPTEKSGRELLQPLLDEIQGDPNVTIHTDALVREVSGCVGDFRLTVERHPDGADAARSGAIILHSGAIVLATGFDLYEPRTGEFAYGESSQVITLAQLEELLGGVAANRDALEYGGLPIRNVCLIHCVGSRQIEGLHEPGPDGRTHAHCSRVCCTATLRAAADLRRRFPEINVFELYRDVRTYGRGHEEYYDEAARQGVLFVCYKPEHAPIVSTSEGANGFPLSVTVRDTLTFGEELRMPADLVVLATGMVPRNLDVLIEQLKLSRSADGFLQEVHPKLRPVELAVSGVFVAGTCQAPMDVAESCASGSAAAAKVAALLGKGHIELDPFRARVDAERCRGEGKCAEVCRHQQAITLVEVGGDGPTRRAEVNAALCNGCGMCVAACPNGAIEVDGWQLDQFDAMVDALVREYV